MQTLFHSKRSSVFKLNFGKNKLGSYKKCLLLKRLVKILVCKLKQKTKFKQKRNFNSKTKQN